MIHLDEETETSARESQSIPGIESAYRQHLTIGMNIAHVYEREA